MKRLVPKYGCLCWQDVTPKRNAGRRLFSDNIASNVTVVKGRVSSVRSIPKHIETPDYYKKFVGDRSQDGKIQPIHIERRTVNIKSEQDIVAMRKAGRLARKMLDFAEKQLKAGMTTDELDRLVHEEIIKHNAFPSTLGYKGFPKSLSVAVNEVLAHGIPDDRPLQNGDIITVDITVFLGGFHGDNCATFIVGEGDDAITKLRDTAKKARDDAIAVVKPGASFEKIASTICNVARSGGYSVIPNLIGHGIGRNFHEAPPVNHTEGDCYPGPMRPGMTFTIEPILVEGKDTRIGLWPDGWTLVSKAMRKSAQFEHTILVTNTGAEVLTSSDE